jgi:hypothetical protein
MINVQTPINRLTFKNLVHSWEFRKKIWKESLPREKNFAEKFGNRKKSRIFQEMVESELNDSHERLIKPMLYRQGNYQNTVKNSFKKI